MEKDIRFTRNEKRIIVRGLYDMHRAILDDDPQKQDLELLLLRVIDVPEINPYWKRLFK